MTCTHSDPACPECAPYLERERQGRRLVDLLDGGQVPEQVRREVIAGRWSEETRRWVEAL
jgi:hypothetical protein